MNQLQPIAPESLSEGNGKKKGEAKHQKTKNSPGVLKGKKKRNRNSCPEEMNLTREVDGGGGLYMEILFWGPELTTNEKNNGDIIGLKTQRKIWDREGGTSLQGVSRDQREIAQNNKNRKRGQDTSCIDSSTIGKRDY